MLPKGPLGRHMIRKLRVYAGPTHPHSAQSPSRSRIDPGPSDRVSCTSDDQARGVTPTRAKPLIQATGRRKAAIARVRLRPGAA